LPFFATATAASLLATAPLQPFTLPAALAYGIATGAEALRVTRGERDLAPLVWLIFPTLHFSHGAGFAVGAVRYALFPDWPAHDERLPPREPPHGA
jgi:hypothetical protein